MIPTKQTDTLEKLSEKERNIYEEIMLTTLAMFAADSDFEEAQVEINVNGMLFEKKGKTERIKGWQSLFNRKGYEEQDKEERNESSLPLMMESEVCSVYVNMKEGKTTPPKLFTEGHLIRVMKRAGKDVEDKDAKEALKQSEGIGTEATRANIIETLKGQKYIEVKKNIVSVTEKGNILCQAVTGTLLASPEMTGKWEQYLHTIGQGKGSQDAFLGNIEKFIQTLLVDAPKGINQLDKQVEKMQEASSVGACPSCEAGSIERRQKESFMAVLGIVRAVGLPYQKSFARKH